MDSNIDKGAMERTNDLSRTDLDTPKTSLVNVVRRPKALRMLSLF